IVLLLCGGVILFIYYPDLFSSSSDKNALDMPPVTTQPVQPETQLSDTIEQKDTIKEITPDVPKVVTPTPPVAQKEETAPAKAEPQTAPQQPATSAYLDSASYKITGTKTKYTIKEGETLTRVSLRFYGTKAMWPYIVKHNPKVIKNPNNVPYGTTIEIPELTKE
ncbi:LysM peptidoglycan-binding domain-containing protein, partial [Bacteroides xylanisolvens]